MIQYPRKGLWSIGFLTNDNLGNELGSVDDELVAVFIPTTPNPTSGFIIMSRKDEIVELGMTVEDGFKLVISMGVITPQDSALKKMESNKVAQSQAES